MLIKLTRYKCSYTAEKVRWLLQTIAGTEALEALECLASISLQMPELGNLGHNNYYRLQM